MATRDACRWDPSGLAVRETAVQVAMWLVTLYFGTYWAKWAVEVAGSDESAGHVKLENVHDCPDCILQIALIANNYANLSHLKGTRRRELRV